MKFFADFSALSVSHALPFPGLRVLFKSQRFVKPIKRMILLLSAISEATVYAEWHLGQAHQASFKVYASGDSLIALSSIDCPVGASALTLGLMSSGAAEAECAFVLLTQTPGVELRSWCTRLNVREQRGGRRGKSCLRHGEAALGQLLVQRRCSGFVRAQKGRGLSQACSSTAGFCSLKNLFIIGKTFIVFIISTGRRSMVMGAKTLPDPPAGFPWLGIVPGCSFLPPRTRLLPSHSLARVTLQILRLAGSERPSRRPPLGPK